ncbi:uncharacterized protein NECHADRAFT_75681 [Fusarium vanettenii 77-13-4]|uniref:D-xylose 1-dehydrogenase (NADP(+), D-xylono-1,5-lactone-forming) n=1 Tax=Fusarium vanettenii (strain ATCC MYA-4622 / CBS 123669 / FGSC 9596 / NRRL 45880 / 77-13-4) TaxID=660122 RepID=C7YJH6_FUSV7|nr:uncharacterized protein NECHADRAFT_75681 [Fusarium vanettenii 77-13-4]EEU48975.1 hypothetical protein NECHADRAFT_75681 [Fusarium vanettenii 77-13-4]
MSSPRIIRWGILATGEIAKTLFPTCHCCRVFVFLGLPRKIVLEEPGTASASAYGSHSERTQDDNVDIIHVATPHSHHYQNVMMCLEAGKNVLCEKAFTVNSAHVKRLAEGHIGNVKRVKADCNFATDPEETFKGGKHRLVNPALAGGALLDLGVYSLTWPFLALHLTQPIETRKRHGVQAVMEKYPPDHLADETTTMLLTAQLLWEADEAALALMEGRKEGRLTTLEESIAMMEVMDEVRRQGGLQYSDEIESVEYPVKLGSG